jgi:chemotaxis protein CheC
MRQTTIWQGVMGNPQLLEGALSNTAVKLSAMVGQSFHLDALSVQTIPLGQLPRLLGAPDSEIVGVYLQIAGALHGQALLIFGLDDAQHFAHVLLDSTPNDHFQLDELECSALAELGNLMLSAFLNTTAVLIGAQLRPSPPAVMVDMVGAILEVMATSVAEVSDHLLVIDTLFTNPRQSLRVRFWVLPDPAELPLAA